MSLVPTLKDLRAGRAHVKGHAALLFSGTFDRGRIRRLAKSDREHLLAAVDWLKRAQDVTGDGGICGRYRLDRGWTSSYPETTGYLVPTLLALGWKLHDQDLRDRAKRAIEFLLPLQLPDGAFPGLEVKENRTAPSPFNTAQIVNGLVAWHRETQDERALQSARRAGDWLIANQEPDGSWKKHVYMGVSAAYHAHASCWLAELGSHCGDEKYVRAAERHMDWVLSLRDRESGFFDRAGFSEADHAARRSVTHTLAYTLFGVLFTGEVTERNDAIEAVRFAAAKIARRLELDGELPGVLDHRFKRAAHYQCLTGNAQMALIWMRLFQHDGDARWINAALKAIDLVKAAQPFDNPNPGIRGGIPGSDPVTGGYITLALPNWAAKFFLDALLAKERVLDQIEREGLERPQESALVVPASPPAPGPRLDRSAPRIVLLSTPRSKKCARLLAALDAVNVKPAAIVIENPKELPFAMRLRAAMREEGLAPLWRKLGRRSGAPGNGGNGASTASDSIAALAHARGIECLIVPGLEDPHALEQIRKLHPDVCVTAGVGILRRGLLEIPTLGTLNAHMGMLPTWRGMNVAEWAALHRAIVGVTVHLVDAGIDTGDLLTANPVDVEGCTSIEQLRERCDRDQLERLAQVLAYVQRSGTLPPRTKQRPADGIQFFTMHPALREILERRLARAKA